MAGPFDEFMEIVNRFTDQDRLGSAVETALGSESCRVAAISGVREHFMKSVSPDGIPWGALARPRPGGSGADNPLRDSDRLMVATTAEVEGTSISVQNNRRQAALQHYGGTIVPVSAQFLAIPNTLEAKRHGSPRSGPGGPFPRPLTIHINAGKTGGVLVDDEGQVQYWLTKKTVIPARPFIGFSAETIEIILNIVSDRIVKAAMGGTP